MPAGLVHWFKFEGNYRDSWSAADFVVSQMRFVPGHQGLGLRSCACNPPAVQTDLLLSNSWTWVGWLKWDGPDQLHPQWAYTFAKLGGPTKNDDDIHMYVLGSADPEWIQGDTPGNLRVTFHDKTWNITGVPMPVGERVHVAVVYHSENGSLELYMNGNLMRVLTAGLPRDPIKLAIMFIGYTRADQHFNGVIDEVLLFARDLEPSEI